VVSIGINDLHFSDVMTACGHPVNAAQGAVWSDDSCPGRKMDVRLAGLARKYKQLSDDIKTLLIAKEIYIIGYPVNLLEKKHGDRHVCECLDVYNSGINNNDFNALGYVGRRLNIALANAARVHGWSYISGVTEAFAGRGYCEDGGSRFFRRVRESVKMQGKEHGGVHPNEKGHRAIRDLLVASVKLDTNTRPHKRVTVTFNRVKVGKIDNGSRRFLEVRFTIQQRLKQPFQDFLSNVPPLYEARFSDDDLPNGRWVDLPAGKFSLTFDVFRSPNPPRYVTDFDIGVVGNGINRHRTSLAGLETFGEGTHIVVTPEPLHDQFGIEYTISVRNLAPSDPVGPPLVPDDAGGGTVK
jgi:hypothetical protein